MHQARSLLQIALVCIDEVHLLNEMRGSALEAGVVSRVKMVSSFREMQEVTSYRHTKALLMQMTLFMS